MTTTLPTSALFAVIAARASQHPDVSLEDACAELDRRFPVAVDRRQLDCFTHCQVGDDVEVRVDATRTDWYPGRVVKFGDYSSGRFIHTSGDFGAEDPACIRWPQSRTEFDHAAWIASLKPGDRVEWHFIGDGTWETLDVVACPHEGVALKHPSGSLTTISIKSGDHPKRCRPLQNVKVEHLTSIVSAADACVELVKERDTLRETIAAKDAENKARESVNAGFWETLVERKEIIDSLRAQLETERAEVAMEKAAIARTVGEPLASCKASTVVLTLQCQLDALRQSQPTPTDRKALAEATKEITTLKGRCDYAFADAANLRRFYDEIGVLLGCRSSDGVTKTQILDAIASLKSTSEIDAKIVQAVRGRIDSAGHARRLADEGRYVADTNMWNGVADALEGKS